MNWFDYLLLVLVAGSVMAGLQKGLARSLIGLAAVVIGLVCGLWFYGVAGAFFYQYLSSRQLAHLLGFLTIFLAAVVGGWGLAALLGRLLKWVHLSWLDHLMGGGFGLLRGALVAAGLVLVVMAFAPKPPPRAVRESRLAPTLVDAARLMASAAPYEVRRGFKESYDRLKQFKQELLERRPREIQGEKL